MPFVWRTSRNQIVISWCCIGELFKALFPDFHEQTPVVLVTGAQGGKVIFFPGGISGDKINGGQFQTTQKFAEEEPGDTTVEVVKRMNGKQTALGKSEGFQKHFIHVTGGGLQPDAEILTVVTH